MSDINDLKNKDIETQSNKGFFSKKNSIIIVSTFLLSIALIVLTLLYILKIDWKDLFIQLGNGFSWDLGWLWFTLLVLFVPWTFFCRVITITIKMKQLGYHIKFWDKLMYTTTVSFLMAVTPANFVSDPYTIFWLKTHGVSTSKASALTACNALLWEIAQLLVTLPSLIWIIVNWNYIFGTEAHDASSGLIIFILMLVGIAIDFIGLGVMLIAGFSRKLHYLLSRIFNRTKKLLRLPYHTKEQTYQTYVVEAKLQKEFLLILKLWNTTIVTLVVVAINEIYLYFTIVLSLYYLAGLNNPEYTLNWLEIFNVANVTTTANRFVPLPGGELSIEWILREFMLTKIGGITSQNPDTDVAPLVNNSIMVWRCWSNYFPAIVGMFGFGSLTISQIKQYRLQHKK